LWVELPEERRYELRVSPSYLSLAGDDGVAADIRRGRAFIRRLGERWSTIRRVMEATARDQRSFVLEGPAALHPLTRSHVAAQLGLHESTVSRAVAGRSALLPCGRVVPLSAFFTASLSAQAALRDLVARERRPLSDDELAAALTADGHPVARRTVAKYRSLLDIPPSTQRETRFAPGTGAAKPASAVAVPAR
jgi:RNA polymerase sigma-54 factor